MSKYPENSSQYCIHTEWKIYNNNEDKDYICQNGNERFCYGRFDCPDYKPRKPYREDGET